MRVTVWGPIVTSESDVIAMPVLVLAATRAAPGAARAHLQGLAGDLPAATVDDALLMASELVTNAVVHGAPDITVAVTLGPGRLGVSVGDLSDVLPAMPSHRVAAVDCSGRGLRIVNCLATRWGVTSRDGELGKQVWFELEFAQASRP